MEFFERQRLKTLTDHSKSQKKKASQDLLALHTVGRVHSPFPVKQQNTKLIRKLDLEKFKSCTRQIEDVDLGPCSPNTKSSKLLLNEVTNGHFNSSQKTNPQNSIIQTSGPVEQNISHKHLGKKGTGTVVNKLEKEQTNKRLFQNSTQTFQFSKPQLTAECKQKLLVHEDFSTTPLIHYQQKMTVGEHASKRHKSHHRDVPGYRTGQIELMHGSFQESVLGGHSTSTPISLPHQPFSFDSMKLSRTTEYLSPIEKESAVSESDFIFKPRPMFSEMQDMSYNSTGSQPFTPAFFEDQYGRSKPFYATKNNIIYLYKTLKTSGSDALDSRKSHTSSICSKSSSFFTSAYEKSASSLTSAYEKSDSAENDFDVQNTAIMKPGGGFSSLTKYRQNMIAENYTERLPMSDCELNSSISETSFSKPSFTGIEDDFEYRPSKIQNSRSDGSAEIQNTSYKSELNSSIPETSFLKPSFTGIEDDFEYRPSKRQNSRSDGSAELKNTNHKRSLDIKGQERCSKRAGGLSSESLPSPKNADVFPKNCQVQIVPQCSKRETNCTEAERVNSSDQFKYKPHQERSENILDEINQLEFQDQDSQDKSLTVYMPSLLPKDGKCSESFEAEVYVDNDQKLMEDDIEYYNNHVAKQPVTEAGSAALLPEKQPSSQEFRHGENSSFSSPVFNTEQHIGIPMDEHVKTVTTLIESKQNINISVNKTKNISQMGQHLHTCSKVESHLQDPEISSGKNRYTQTESPLTMFSSRDVEDAATSPLLHVEHSQHDACTQCDLYKEVCRVPSLKQIAGNCFIMNLIQSKKSANDSRVCENEP